MSVNLLEVGGGGDADDEGGTEEDSEPLGTVSGFDQIISAIVSEVESDLKKQLQDDKNPEADLVVTPVSYAKLIKSGTYYFTKVHIKSHL